MSHADIAIKIRPVSDKPAPIFATCHGCGHHAPADTFIDLDILGEFDRLSCIRCSSTNIRINHNL